ncbi:hypothetical protein BC939DRAFT_68491 [Gamsiella multidivaricata]|uniref:uncharacterized protein n=1 Tax=Gamsiella multidivaricata TaxID=101098 RepID=UPI00222104B3|nr:uncharacterized protein BC939DRAFT_68491 [Gamsiella multidivaricata]KAI7828118.1 hypothetical protein BC939DRAFT_68491 [Gamsiella multidivaricata]
MFILFAGAFLALALYGALVITLGIGLSLYLAGCAYRAAHYVLQGPVNRTERAINVDASRSDLSGRPRIRVALVGQSEPGRPTWSHNDRTI